MLIRKLTATFGCLQNAELALHEGLNIITAPNEFGKSTWCAFLRSMLYGIDTTRREKAGYKPDKTRYAPWSGAAMEGTMELSWQGRDYTLSRSTRLASAPLREVRVLYSGTAQPAKELAGSDLGETLTGVSPELFERTAFIGQAALSVTPGAELEKRIAAIVTSGEEDTSLTEASKRLKAWQRGRSFRGKGRLPELEGEMGELRRRLSNIERASAELQTLEDREAACLSDREWLEKEAETEKREQRKAALAALSLAGAEARRLERETEERRRELRERRAALDESPLAGLSPDALDRTQTETLARAAALAEGKRAPAQRKWLSFLLLALALAAGAAGALRLLPLPLCLSAAGTLAGGAFLNALLSRLGRDRRRTAAETALASLLAEYGAGDEEDLQGVFDRYRAGLLAAKEAEARCQAAETASAQAEALRAHREKHLMDSAPTEAEASLRRAEARLLSLREERALAKGRMETLGDSVALSSRLCSAQTEKERAERELQALQLALETLEAADGELQAEFSPALAKKTAEYMSRLTGGRYGELTLDRQLSALVKRREDAVAHDAGFLSRGACDQFYLALRLALCQLALPGAEPCPLVLDDALLSFDGERLGYALELLRELAQGRQILLFTCQDREKRYADKHFA